LTPDGLADAIAVAADFTVILERLGIPYLVGGSFASSVYGEPRSTNDIDIVADVRSEALEGLLEELTPEFYVSRTAARQAVRHGSSFNAIHIAAAVKVDVFVAGKDPFEAERLEHRRPVPLSTDPPVSVYMDTAEHSILRKLEWFRRGGEVSDRQWRDVIAMLRIQGSRLDRARLEGWADRLGVADLLERAEREADARTKNGEVDGE
jgi:hypothetical protein